MQAASNFIVAIGIAALVILYVLELINTRRGGSPNLSQKLLRWQSVLQSPCTLYLYRLHNMVWLAHDPEKLTTFWKRSSEKTNR
jgi:hypothetical protein